MISTTALNMYRTEQMKRRAALFLIDEQRRIAADELKQVDSLIRVLENVEKAEQKVEPKLQAEREAADAAAFARGKAEGLAATKESMSQPQQERRRKK